MTNKLVALLILLVGMWASGCQSDKDSQNDVGESDADTDADTDGDSDTDSDTDTDSDSDSDADGDTDADTDTDSDTDADGDTDVDTDTDNDTNTDSDTNTDTDTGSDSQGDMDTGANTDADSETRMNMDTDSDSLTDIDQGTDSQLDSGEDSETEISEPSSFVCYGTAGAPLENGALPTGYCAWVWATGLDRPRGLATTPRGDVLVVERGRSRISLLHDDNGDGVSTSEERMEIASANGLNHGIALGGGFLYASSGTTIYRWAYDDDRVPRGTPETVVTGMPAGGHSARTLVFDGNGGLYVNIGSENNVDADSSRARVIHFSAALLSAGATYDEASVIADGTRNENALALDAQGRLWGVENGSDNLSRDDLGEEIYNDNPGEELNLFESPGAFYGYPYCWSEGNLDGGMGATTQWAYDPQSAYSDEWCRNTDNVIPPVLVLQAHSAPLDILFYRGGLFPDSVIGDAFIGYHGSWNRQPQTGYKVVHLPFGEDGMPTGAVLPFLEFDGDGDTGDGWPYRPVDLATGNAGQLIVSSDADGTLLAIGYDGT